MWGVAMTIEEAYFKWADDLTRYAAMLVGTHDAADVVADAFVGLLRRDASVWGSAREPRAYLFGVVLNTARMRLRSSSRRARREALEWSPPAVAEFSGDPSIIAAVAALSVRQRAAIYLAYWEDLNVDVISEIIGASVGATKRHLARARANLREVLA